MNKAASFLYKQLSQPTYQHNGYETCDLGDDMAVVHQSISGWWKPRFLMDHRAKCAYEFMNANEVLVTISDKDIDWNSLKRLTNEYIAVAKAHDGHFPTLISRFMNNRATVEWQINPDGRYYMDEDGYGMTDDEEITLHGTIDRAGNVVKKFRYIG